MPLTEEKEPNKNLTIGKTENNKNIDKPVTDEEKTEINSFNKLNNDDLKVIISKVPVDSLPSLKSTCNRFFLPAEAYEEEIHRKISSRFEEALEKSTVIKHPYPRVDKLHYYFNDLFTYISSLPQSATTDAYLGYSYANGIGVAPDCKKGISLFKRAILDCNSATAAKFFIKKCVANSKEVKSILKDDEYNYLLAASLRLLENAAENRHPRMAKHIAHAHLYTKFNIDGVENNLDSANKWLQFCCSNDIDISLEFLDYVFFLREQDQSSRKTKKLSKGIIDYSIETSKKVYEKFQNPIVASMIGSFFLDDNRDRSSALQWFKKAEDNFNLAYMYKMGWGVKQSYQRAKELYLASCSQGNQDALQLIFKKDFLDDKVTLEETEIIDATKDCFRAGNTDAAAYLCRYLKKDNCTDELFKSPGKVFWFQLSAQCGDLWARKNLVIAANSDNNEYPYAKIALGIVETYGSPARRGAPFIDSDIEAARKQFHSALAKDLDIIDSYIAAGKADDVLPTYMENLLLDMKDDYFDFASQAPIASY